MDQAQTLLRLQEIDVELMRAQKEFQALPQRQKIADLDAKAKDLAATMRTIVGRRKDLEIDIFENREQLAQAEQAVSEAQATAQESASDYKAVRDLELKLTNLAKRIEKLDFDYRELESKLESAQQSEQKALDVAQLIRDNKDKLKVEFEHRITEIQAHAADLKSERAELVNRLEPELLANYEKLRVEHKGIAVERLEGTKPSVCRVNLQPSEISDLRGQGHLTRCPYCKRILFYAGEYV